MNLTGKKTILVIDDEPSTGVIIKHFLEEDFEVIVKEDGTDAMLWLEQGNEPDLIISDLSMPQMDGYDFVSSIRASLLFGDIPIIVLSGSEDSAVRIKCLELGADDFIVKPFNPRELKARVAGILRRFQKVN